MAETQRVEVGFAGGQVVSVRLEESHLGELRKALEEGEGWRDLETQDGPLTLDLSKVVFVRIAGSGQAIGFSGS
jgi:hypothetical protein